MELNGYFQAIIHFTYFKRFLQAETNETFSAFHLGDCSLALMW